MWPRSDPDAACSADHALPEGSIGDRSWLRLSDADNDDSSFDKIPLTEDEMFTRVANGQARSFTEGGCLPSGLLGPGSQGMGYHYWQVWNGTPEDGFVDSSCGSDWGPLFYLYSDNKLVSYGALVSTESGATPIQEELGQYGNWPAKPTPETRPPAGGWPDDVQNPGGNLWNQVGYAELGYTVSIPMNVLP